jgi:hypothetical protein
MQPHPALRRRDTGDGMPCRAVDNPDVPAIALETVEREEVRCAIDAQREIALHGTCGREGDERSVVVRGR